MKPTKASWGRDGKAAERRDLPGRLRGKVNEGTKKRKRGQAGKGLVRRPLDH